MNVPDTCKALGSSLRTVVDAFWAAYPETNVHFFIETDRFCQFLKAKIVSGFPVAPEVEHVLARESAAVAAALAESYTEDSHSYDRQ
jgi:hypothetical protein